MQQDKSSYASFVHVILLALTLTTLMYQPNFASGLINHFEAGQWLVAANDVLHGKIICKETIAFHGPLTTYFQILFLWLFGFKVMALKWFFVVGSFSTLFVASLIGYKLFRSRLLMYFLAFFLVVETVSPFWSYWWGGFRFCFGLMGLWFFIDYMQNEKTSSAFLTGFVLALTLFMSIDVFAALVITVFGGYVFFVCGCLRHGKAMKIRHIMWCFLGFSAFAMPFCLYLLKIGAFASYLETTFILAVNHARVWGQPNAGINFARAISIGNVLKIEFKVVAAILIDVLAVIYAVRRFRNNTLQWQECGMFSLAIYGALMWLLSFRAAIGPQFQMALQPALILSFCFVQQTFSIVRQYLAERAGSLYSRVIKERAPSQVILALIFFCILVSYIFLSEKVPYCDTMDFVYYQMHKEDFIPEYTSFMPVEVVHLVASTSRRAAGMKVLANFTYIESASKYIASVTEPDEQVFSFPDLGICNFLADRACFGRFGIAVYAWTCRQWQEELLSDLSRLKPRYIIGGNVLSDLARSIGRESELLPEVIDYINSNYFIEASFGPIDILKSIHRQ